MYLRNVVFVTEFTASVVDSAYIFSAAQNTRQIFLHVMSTKINTNTCLYLSVNGVSDVSALSFRDLSNTFLAIFKLVSADHITSGHGKTWA